MFGNFRIVNVFMLVICIAWVAYSYGGIFGIGGPRQSARATYGVPIAEAHRLLEQTSLPPFVFDKPELELKIEAGDPAKVSFLIMDNNKETMRFTADLVPVSDRSTHVTVTLKGVTSGAFGNVEERLTANPSLRALYVTSMNEQIAAALEHRDYKISNTYPALAAAMTANIKNIRTQFDKADAAFKQRDRDAIAKAYADEAAGRFQIPGPRPIR